MKSVNEIKEYILKYAKKCGYILNPDEKQLDFLCHSLLEMKEALGELYCPLRVNIDITSICPCIYHEKEIEEDGYCYCHLFFKGKNENIDQKNRESI